VVGYGHIEQPLELWLALVAARKLQTTRSGPAGIALGLAVLARSTAGFYLPPLALAAARSGPKRLLRFAGGMALTVTVVLLPLYLADGVDVAHSLAGYRAALPIGSGSVWVVLASSPLGELVRGADLPLALAVAVVISVWAALRAPDPDDAGRFHGWLLAAACCFPMLAKTVWPYYLLDPYVFAVIWALAQGARRLRIAAPAVLAGLGLLAEVGADAPPAGGLRLGEGIVATTVTAAMLAVVVLQTARRPVPGADLAVPSA